ncbi:MAG: serpin family protein [Bacillota bacterium]
MNKVKNILCLVMAAVVASYFLAGCVSQSSNPGLSQDISSGRKNVNSSAAEGNMRFAFDIFRKLNNEDKKENIFISPLSISTALSMVYQGAEGTTREAMAAALGYEGMQIERINEYYKKILRALEETDKKVQLNIGNSIWLRRGAEIKKDFISSNKDVFNAQVKTLDFSKDEAADEINNWVSDSTKGKIQKIINPPIPEDVMMYLLNAIYFKGEWKEQFDKSQTFASKFRSGSGKKQEVMMMRRKGDMEYGKGEDFKAVRLPYGDGKISMYCILPDEGISVDSFIKEMDSDKWKGIKQSISKTEDVMLQLPRFKIEYGAKDLNKSLSELGMGEAFSESANFTGISKNAFINKVAHKAVIEVNEEGSEAAAVTTVVVFTSGLADPINFIADRPFIFLIADEEHDAILFMGKLYNVK